jgi:hypothetical protein
MNKPVDGKNLLWDYAHQLGKCIIMGLCVLLVEMIVCISTITN